MTPSPRDAAPDPTAPTLAPAAPADDGTLTQPPNGAAPPAALGEADVPPGYAIERELGRGGMGVVYLARDLRLNRPVALKMVLSGAHAGPQELARFLQEAEAVAQLRHPNVVQVYGFGEHQGRPYMALEFCDGGGLDRQFAGNPVKPEEAARLVMAVAAGVQAAHDHGIVHRDLKPQNVLLADGQPKVTDFGLAKRAGGGSELTATGAILGTPSYMAPEQAEGKGKQVGPAADVYSLGAILYEALTGRPPFRAATPLDTVLQVVKEEPVPPRRLNPVVPADLETIALKCLQKDPKKRYPTAADLAEDLRRWRAGEPIAARPVGRPERAWKWARRNKGLAASAAGIAAALLVGTATATWQAVRASREADRADDKAAEATREAGRAEANALDARTKAEAARQEQARAEKALADLKAERGQSAEYRYATRINRAYAEWQALNSNYARSALTDAPVHLRGWEWAFLDRLFNQSSLPLRGHAAAVVCAALSPDGTRAYTAAGDGTVRVWDARTGAELRTLNLPAHRVAVSPDGRRVALASGRLVRLYDPDGARELTAATVEEAVYGLAFTRGGRDLVVVTADGMVTVRDPATGAERSRATKRLEIDRDVIVLLNAGVGMAVSPDGKLVAQGGSDGKVRVWDAAAGEPVMEGEGHTSVVGEPAFAPDGKSLASPGRDGTIRVWDLTTKQTVRILRGHRSWVWTVAYSPDGTRLASASRDLTGRVWDPATGESLLTLIGHGGEARGVALSGDGARVVTVSPDGTARVWEAAGRVFEAAHVREAFAEKKAVRVSRTGGSAEHLTFYGHTTPAMTVACSPDGRLIATSAAGDETGHRVTVWDVDARREVARLPGPEVRGLPLAFTPDGKRLVVAACAAADKPARVTAFDLPGGAPAWTWVGPPATLAFPAVSADGRRVAVVTQGTPPVLAVLDAGTGQEVYRKELPGKPVGPAFLSDGRGIVTADSGTGAVRVSDVESGDEVRVWKATNSGALTAVAAGPGGRVATADARAVIAIWDGNTGRALETLEGHAGQILQMVFGPEGRLASVGSDFTARVWDTGTGHELLTFRDHADVPTGVAWSRDGSRLATACADGALRVWQGPPPDAAPSAEAWPVVYEDRFDRAEPGERWTPKGGTWDVRDGALRGAQVAKTEGRLKFNFAMAGLTGVDLPNRADVRFRFRVARPMAVVATLADRTGKRLSYSAIVAGPCDLPGSPATLVLQITRPTEKEEDMKAVPLGLGAKFDMKGGEWYPARLLREPERLRLWVGGELVLAERIPDVDLPGLSLQGSWGAVGDVVEFDDLVIRAPAEASRALALRFKAEDLFEKVRVRGEVRRQLAAEAGVTADDLVVIDRALAGLAEEPVSLEARAWAVVRRAGATAEEYRLALARAEAAARPAPDDPDRLATLGMAQLRAGDPKAAVKTLTKSVARAREEHGAARPADHAGLALAHHALGDRAAAKAEARRLWSLMLGDRWANAGPARVLVGEVEEALGDDAKVDPGAEAIVRRVLQGETDGWTRGDLAAYLSLFTPDAVSRNGRGEQPDAYDVPLDRKQLEAVRRIQFRRPPDPGMKFSFEDAAVTVTGDAAELRWLWTVHGEFGFQTFAGRYRLVQVGGEWKVKEVRGWQPARRLGGEREVLSPAEWAARDKAADALAMSPDVPARVAALKKADRHAEAFRLAREATEAGKGDAALWAERGDLAFTLGDVPGALAAFARAEELDPDVRLPWYMTRARLAFRGHGREGAATAAYLPGGERVASVGGDGNVRIWEAKTGTEVKRIGAGEPLAGLAVSPDGTRVAASGQNVWLYDPATGKQVAVGKGHAAIVFRVHFRHDGKRVVSASADGTARVWDAVTGKELVKFSKHGQPVLGAEYSPDGKYVVSCGTDDLARLWDAETGEEVRVFKGHAKGLKRAVFSPDGKRLATASMDRTVKVWDVPTGELLRTLEGHEQFVDVAAFSPDGKLLATGDWAGVIRLWNPETGAKTLTIFDHPGEVYALSFRADGKALVAAGSGWPVVYDLRPANAPEP